MTKQPENGMPPKAAFHQELLEKARQGNTGSRPWKGWREAAVAEVIDLAIRSPRMDLIDIQMSGDLHLAYHISMPVPRRPVDGRLVLGNEAVFHLRYQEDWLWKSPAGWEPLGLLHPFDAFHSNMTTRPDLRGAICLGHLPAGILPRECILMGYFALTLQDRNLDETDPQGVLNPIACEYFRQHPEYLPLTRAGLFDPWEGENSNGQ
jgi:hypothetical protein